MLVCVILALTAAERVDMQCRPGGPVSRTIYSVACQANDNTKRERESRDARGLCMTGVIELVVTVPHT